VEVVVLLAAFVLQVHLSVRQKSAILHEPLYSYAGYQYLTRGAYRVNFDSPPLLKQLAALPLLGADLDPVIGPEERFHPLSMRFFYENRLPPERLLARLRLPFLPLGIVLGVVVFLWARALYGAAGGILALWLYAFSIALLGEAGFANHDFGLTCASVLALYAGWRLCARPTLPRTIGTGIVLGLALVTKFSALLLVPALGALALADVVVRRTREPMGGALLRRAGALAAVLGVAALVVWADYGFGTGAIRVDLYRKAFEHIAPHSLAARVTARLPSTVHVPAALYVEGVVVQMLHGWVGHINYFLGEVSYHGWRHYYLVTLALRTPLPLMVLAVLRLVTWRPGGRGGGGAVRGAPTPAASGDGIAAVGTDGVPVARAARPRWWGELWLLAYAALTFVLFSLGRTQLGLRYVLVIFPLAFVFLGGLAAGGWGALRPAVRAIVTVCLAWYAVDALRTYPDYLTYFNPIAGGPDAGYRLVVEGTDLGQDAAGLQRFVAAHDIAEMQVSCFGCPPPRHLGPAFRPLGCRPVSGWLAVSVRHRVMPEPFLPKGCFDWLAAHEPVARIGHSIHVFHLPQGVS
jgi:hypothetical protein